MSKDEYQRHHPYLRHDSIMLKQPVGLLTHASLRCFTSLFFFLTWSCDSSYCLSSLLLVVIACHFGIFNVYVMIRSTLINKFILSYTKSHSGIDVVSSCVEWVGGKGGDGQK